MPLRKLRDAGFHARGYDDHAKASGWPVALRREMARLQRRLSLCRPSFPCGYLRLFLKGRKLKQRLRDRFDPRRAVFLGNA